MYKIIGLTLLLVTVVYFKIKGGIDMSAIAMVAATLVLKGRLEFKDVPARLKPQVKEILTDLGMPELAEE